MFKSHLTLKKKYKQQQEFLNTFQNGVSFRDVYMSVYLSVWMCMYICVYLSSFGMCTAFRKYFDFRGDGWCFSCLFNSFDSLKFFFLLFSAVKLRPKEGETYFDVVAIVDPVTRDAQRLAPLLLVCIQHCRVFCNNFNRFLFQFCNFEMFVFFLDSAVTCGLLMMQLKYIFLQNHCVLHNNKIMHLDSF